MMLSLQNYNLIKSLIKLNFNFFETNIKTKYLSLNNNNSLSLKHKKLYYILNILKIVKNIKQFIQVLTFFKNLKQKIIFSSNTTYLLYLFNIFKKNYKLSNVIFNKDMIKKNRNNLMSNCLISINNYKNVKFLKKTFKNYLVNNVRLIYEINNVTQLQNLGNYKIYKNLHTWIDFYILLNLIQKKL
jgi:hypothetical protein